jgi:hypothetical protein
MADDPLILKALEQIAIHDTESMRLKRWVNDADIMLGNKPRFDDLGVGGTASIVGAVPAAKRWSPGAFYNKPFSTAVRMILAARFDTVGVDNAPSSVDQIHEALTDGSFSFETNGADAQKNSIRISLGKNSTTFVRLPNSELFGLPEWYGKRPGKPGRKSTAESEPAASAEPQTDETVSDDGAAQSSGDQTKEAA